MYLFRFIDLFFLYYMVLPTGRGAFAFLPVLVYYHYLGYFAVFVAAVRHPYVIDAAFYPLSVGPVAVPYHLSSL